jgi:hypothetical protein
MAMGIRKTSEIAPLGVRMQPWLKDALAESAQRNGRSLNAEIVLRLEKSFQEAALPAVYPAAAEPGTPYPACQPILTQCQQMMLDAFDRLPADKRLALITLLK